MNISNLEKVTIDECSNFTIKSLPSLSLLSSILEKSFIFKEHKFSMRMECEYYDLCRFDLRNSMDERTIKEYFIDDINIEK